jgi:hypothetical protein
MQSQSPMRCASERGRNDEESAANDEGKGSSSSSWRSYRRSAALNRRRNAATTTGICTEGQAKEATMKEMLAQVSERMAKAIDANPNNVRVAARDAEGVFLIEGAKVLIDKRKRWYTFEELLAPTPVSILNER